MSPRAQVQKRVSNEKRKFYSSCHKCGKNYKGYFLIGMNVYYKCGDKGHGQRNCPVDTKLGRLRKLKEVWIEGGLSLDGVMVPNDKVSKSSQVHDDT